MREDRVGGPIRWRLHLAVPPDRVYEALDTDRGRARFWAESAIEEDGSIHFHFSNGVQHKAPILERHCPSLFAIRYFGAELRIHLEEDGEGGTDLLLVHDGVSDWIEVHAGWLNVLFPLKGYVEHQIDLRNHDPRRTWDDGYVDG